MAETIPVGALRERLAKGEPITILDVRDAEDFEEWRIPGARLVEGAYETLQKKEAGPVRTVEVPRDRPVVAVCYRGNSSKIAAQALRERGLDAASLEGGMTAWSLAWNTAEVPLPGGTTRLLQVRRTGKGCLSYIVGSKSEAAVIDPSADTEVYLQLAKEHGWRITRVLDTHVHADHLSRARALASASGAKLYAPRTDRLKFTYEPLDDGSVLPHGDAKLVAMRTPGHTPESTCYQLDDRLLFTGDTLFVDAVGRPDLEADRSQANARAIALHASLQRILKLPAATLVAPCHSGQPVPFDKRPIVAEIRQVRDRVPSLSLERDEFVARILERLPPAPENSHRIVKANEAGETPPADPTEIEAGANRCAAG